MTAADQTFAPAGPVSGNSRSRTHHRGGGLQPLAGAAGRALHPSLHRHGVRLRVFWLPLSRTVQGAPACTDLVQELFATSCNWRVASLGWMYTLFFVLLGSRLRCGAGGSNARVRARPASSRRCAGAAVCCRRARRLHPSALADVARFGRDRRHRPRPRLHLAGVDAGEVVSRPARHGDRHGDHGLRRRRHDRLRRSPTS